MSNAVSNADSRRGVDIAVRGLTADYGAAPVLRGIDVNVAGGEILALLGPSGCGKTTLLRCIAGLERPSTGSIRLGDEEMTAGKGVPAERRRVGMVFQDGALFPHRTVLNNVNYGVDRGPARDQRSRAVLHLVGLDDKADRMPGSLSGGEQQRVALARALAAEPRVVLLDEPFSSLDASLRVQLRDEVRRLLNEVGVTTILVTHDQEEAMSFGDRVAVMNEGLICQIGTPAQIYTAPISPWVARFVGEAAILPATFNSATAQTALGTITTNPATSGRGNVLVRPEQMSLSSGGNSTVVAVHYVGSDTRYEIAVPELTSAVVVRCPGPPLHWEGERVTVTLARTVAHAWPHPSGNDVGAGVVR